MKWAVAVSPRVSWIVRQISTGPGLGGSAGAVGAGDEVGLVGFELIEGAVEGFRHPVRFWGEDLNRESEARSGRRSGTRSWTSHSVHRIKSARVVQSEAEL